MFHILLLAALLFQSPPIREQELSAMVRTRGMVPEEQILDAIRTRGIGFRLTDNIRKNLKKDGASTAVMAEVEKAYDVLKRRTVAQEVAAVKATLPPVVEPPPALEGPQQTALLEETRRNALEYTEKLPNFICVQVTKRYAQIRPDGPWYSQDVIQTRLAYNDRRENYQVISINDQLTSRSYESLGGTTSTGEFGTLLYGIFLPETKARFTYVGSAGLRGRPVHEYSYMVDKENSRWQISWQKVQSIIPAYRGRISVDPETAQVLQLTVEAVNIPPDFPIRLATTILDYDYTAIAGRKYLLPLRAAIELSEGQVSTRNEIQFRQYRRFTADANIVFEEEKEPPKQP